MPAGEHHGCGRPFNQFYLFTGIPIIIIGAIVIWIITRQIVRPVQELTEISKKWQPLTSMPAT